MSVTPSVPALSRTRVLALGAALLAALSVHPSAARAQINPFRFYRGPTLTKSDLDAGQAAAGRLLGATPQPVGATESWTGPDSGNAGTLTIERAYRKSGHDCRAVRSHVTYKNGTNRSFLLQACQVAGTWRLAD